MGENCSYADVKDIVESHKRWEATNDRIKDIEANETGLISPELLTSFDAMVAYLKDNIEER